MDLAGIQRRHMQILVICEIVLRGANVNFSKDVIDNVSFSFIDGMTLFNCPGYTIGVPPQRALLTNNTSNISDYIYDESNGRFSTSFSSSKDIVCYTSNTPREIVSKILQNLNDQPIPRETTNPPTGKKKYSKKDTLTATLLCFFLGVFGAHCFYVGKTRDGVFLVLSPVYFLASVLFQGNALSFLLSLACFVCVIKVYFVDLIMISHGAFTDSKGRKLRKSFGCMMFCYAAYAFLLITLIITLLSVNHNPELILKTPP